MPILTPSQTLLIGFIVAPVLFLASAYFTRATKRRVMGALAGAVAYSALNIVWDRVAAAAGWWIFPFAPTWVETVPLYIPAGLVAGGAFGLVGWRVIRRWPDGSGLVVFLLLWGVWGVIHDYGGVMLMQADNLLTFAPGLAPVIADFFTYMTCGALAQLAIRLVAGPANADPLAQTRPATVK